MQPSAASSSDVTARLDASSRVVIPWLIRLRWVSLASLAVAAWAASAFWQIRLPLLPLLALLAAMAATNLALSLQLRSPAPRRTLIGGALLLDAALLTGVLFLLGGPLNPFSIVYLVGITMAAVTLGRRWAIGLAVFSNVAYGLTFVYNRPFEFDHASATAGSLTTPRTTRFSRCTCTACGWLLPPRPDSSRISSAASPKRSSSARAS